MGLKGEYQQAKSGRIRTKCPLCNSDAWIQTGVVSHSIEGDINSIRMICTNVHCQARFILSQPKKEDKKMSLTAKEFDKAIELNEEIEKIEGCIRKLENPNAVFFNLTWGDKYSFMNEQAAIPRDIEEEIVQRIYEWYKNRLKQAEDEFSELVTRE